MFTGIVEELGRVVATEQGARSARLTVEGPLVAADVAPGLRVDLEPAMAADGRFCGHIVQGHVERRLPAGSTVTEVSA